MRARRFPGRATALAVMMIVLGPAGAFTVPDDRGMAVNLERPATRVVSLAPFITELVYAAGAGDRLIAVSKHSDYPAAARDLPRVGDAFGVNLEALLALRPDLVLSWQTGNDQRLSERLESLGTPVFVMEPRRIADVPGALERIGRLLGTEEEAERQAADFTRDIEAIRARYAGRETVRVYYEVSRQPLMTLNGQHMFTAILDLCGGRNVFHDSSPIAPTINREQVLARDPQAILISSADPDSDDLAGYWSRYPSLTAARLGNLYFVDGDLINRQTPRLVEGARQVCARLDRARRRIAAQAG